MYRYSQTLPGGPITLVGVLALCFLIPGWTANVLGFGAANALLVGAGMAVYAAYLVLTRSLVAVRNWAVRTSVAAARLMGVLLCWAPQIVVGLLCDQIQSATAKLTAYRQERRQLR